MAKQTIEELAEALEAALPAEEHEHDFRLRNGSVIKVLRLKRPDK